MKNFINFIKSFFSKGRVVKKNKRRPYLHKADYRLIRKLILVELEFAESDGCGMTASEILDQLSFTMHNIDRRRVGRQIQSLTESGQIYKTKLPHLFKKNLKTTYYKLNSLR